ncbi:NADH:ubiquinone reductase (Na(+)-transporting) subunit A [Shewanella xiamenensis]|uniref:Na(+)-translocating NADH-quinone reductase subunit A n=1 Tax=Shewanella xiamenensis TaxID=332186 RepID=UPI001186A848|nr:Na(+)-translocating NADH-quinone reductase subunit A [Shewanella xiamenensis]TVL12942.1 NADH:ubiquinone reductase (Na(+)-transporting) subunit A [Shewanella xiamenensis]TVL13213.1 NADH:ubiquinone reductase (Na(+)-transporting) subunit A [Shewanella xiamenensis]TVL20699.1 NADH:ubiquinone reductase (Na(+)-transporting) subunit A [Shewanella xiamenensis]TVL26778.1 NADH:ubiquinone reductase (Na(+)-transporting) subunit A [Shewanella xiamenensis]TVO95788.1 NADH:ubiquinone reductase (Na(+)-transp
MADFSNQVITIKKGLDLPISGEPRPIIEPGNRPSQVALLGEEYVGLKPTMLVEVGDKVKKGQPLFEDKKTKGVLFTAPASGEIVAINRGERRVLQSVVIRCNGLDADEQIRFDIHTDLQALSAKEVQAQLVNSGLWTALRTRPFSRVPALDSKPAGIFVTAMDTNPLAADPRLIIAEQRDAFKAGLAVLSHLTEGKVYLCQDKGEALVGTDLPKVEVRRFAGVHPAGLAGTHIHFTLPVSIERQVWHIGYQDVIAYGKLFQTGELYTDRVVALGGPSVLNPRLLRTQLGAELSALVVDEIKPGNNRVVSGSVLSGHTAQGVHDFLGRFHNQVSVLAEDAQHQVLPWVRGGSDKFSITRAVTSRLFGLTKSFEFTTHQGGSQRAMMAFGQLDRVMPLDILPTLLVRDLVVRDTDEAQALGALELDEEDLALCTFVCPGKYDFGKELRACLDVIEREG